MAIPGLTLDYLPGQNLSSDVKHTCLFSQWIGILVKFANRQK